MISKRQFDVLTFLAQSQARKTQREIAQNIGISIGAVNKTISELAELGFASGAGITESGRTELEQFRVKRAILLAAGFGSRMAPITFSVPKPLVRVKGKRIIDSLLDALIAQGITEIYIVRGYLAEQFDQLLYKYPTIKFIENPVYNETGNISSTYCARYFMQNAYVFESDIYLFNPNLITKYQYCSNYLGVPVDKTDDWCIQTANGRITKLSLGGVNGYLLCGISYWTGEDGAKLADDIRDVYQSPGGKEQFWDQVALSYCSKNYHVSVRECSPDDYAEIDTVNELKKLDAAYNM